MAYPSVRTSFRVINRLRWGMICQDCHNLPPGTNQEGLFCGNELHSLAVLMKKLFWWALVWQWEIRRWWFGSYKVTDGGYNFIEDQSKWIWRGHVCNILSCSSSSSHSIDLRSLWYSLFFQRCFAIRADGCCTASIWFDWVVDIAPSQTVLDYQEWVLSPACPTSLGRWLGGIVLLL